MSTSCSIKVEFTHPLTENEVNGLRNQLQERLRHFPVSESEALWLSEPDSFECKMLGYSGFSVDDNGNLYDDDALGNFKAAGCGYGILAGALGGINYMTRWWDERYPQGPMPQYAVTLLILLSSPLTKRVWYVPDDQKVSPALTRERVHALLDAFVAIEDTIDMPPSRAIWA